jgi:predicted 3-demethylubiquinone-9 3-methyltransferase (glyoxalase superfamily)
MPPCFPVAKWCGWGKDRWGISRQITPRVLTDALAVGCAEAKHVFNTMMEMDKFDITKIEAIRRS